MLQLDTEKLKTVLASHDNIVAALLFGSYVKGPVTPESDIDIAILYDRQRPYDFMQQLALCEKLRAVVDDRKVDLINLLKADPIIKRQIFSNCQVLVMKNKNAYNQLWVQSMNEYDDIKRIRKPMEDNILKGRIHGG